MPVITRALLKVILTLERVAKPVPVTVMELPVVPVVLLKLILGVTVKLAVTAADPVTIAEIVWMPAVAAGIEIAVLQIPATAVTEAKGALSKLTVTASVAPDEVPLTVTLVCEGPEFGLTVMAVAAAWTGAKTTMQANNSRTNNTPANLKSLRIVSGPPLYINIVFIHRIYINEYYVFLISIALIIS